LRVPVRGVLSQHRAKGLESSRAASPPNAHRHMEDFMGVFRLMHLFVNCIIAFVLLIVVFVVISVASTGLLMMLGAH
jgi:hypothetical protein